MYKKARAGEIKNFTGIDAPFEAPQNPNIDIITDELTVEEAANQILEYIIPLITRK